MNCISTHPNNPFHVEQGEVGCNIVVKQSAYLSDDFDLIVSAVDEFSDRALNDGLLANSEKPQTIWQFYELEYLERQFYNGGAAQFASNTVAGGETHPPYFLDKLKMCSDALRIGLRPDAAEIISDMLELFKQNRAMWDRNDPECPPNPGGLHFYQNLVCMNGLFEIDERWDALPNFELGSGCLAFIKNSHHFLEVADENYEERLMSLWEANPLRLARLKFLETRNSVGCTCGPEIDLISGAETTADDKASPLKRVFSRFFP